MVCVHAGTYREGVEFFETYAGAALSAYKKGLISAKDVLAVTDACAKELDEILFLGPEAATTKKTRRLELQQDIDLIHTHLRVKEA